MVDVVGFNFVFLRQSAFALAACYFIVFVLIIKKFCDARQSSSSSNGLPLFFLASLTFSIFMRFISFLTVQVLYDLDVLQPSQLSTQDHQTIDTNWQSALFADSLTVMFNSPDIVTVCTYLILVLVYAEIYQDSYMHLFSPRHYRKKWFTSYLVVVAVFYSALFFLYGLLIFTNIDNVVYGISLLVGACNLACPAMLIVGWLWLVCKFSGFPFKSNLHRSRLAKVGQIVLVWSFGRILWGTTTLVTVSQNWFQSLPDWAPSVVITLLLLVSEVIPFLMAVFSDFLPLLMLESRSMSMVGMSRAIRDTDDLEASQNLLCRSPNQDYTSHEHKQLKCSDQTQVSEESVRGETQHSPSHQISMSRPRLFSEQEFDSPFQAVVGRTFFWNEYKSYEGTIRTQGLQLPEQVTLKTMHLPQNTKKSIATEFCQRILMRAKRLSQQKLLASLEGVMISKESSRFTISLVEKMDTAVYTLADRVSDSKKQQWEWARRLHVCGSMASALASLKECGTCHGRLTPECVVFYKDGSVKLSDWAFADVNAYRIGMSELKNRGCDERMKYWLSPEAFESASYSTTNDVYSLGILIWSLAVWAMPSMVLSDFEDYDSSVRKCLTSDACSATSVVAGLFTMLMQQCLYFDPTQRPTIEVCVKKLISINKLARGS